MTDTPNNRNEYVRQLERLWDLVSDAVEEGRINPGVAPDDYVALVRQMGQCETARDFMSTPEGAGGCSSDGGAPQYIISSGNPIDGLTFIGPFDDPNTAGDYATESNLPRNTWQVVSLMAPGQE